MSEYYPKITALVATLGIIGLSFILDKPDVEFKVEEPHSKSVAQEDTPRQANSHVLADSIASIEEELYYNIGPRFAPIKMSAIRKAKRVEDILNEEDSKNLEGLETVTLKQLVAERFNGIEAKGNDADLNESQLRFLSSLNHSDHFALQAEFLLQNELKQYISDFILPHYTIVPETQTFYIPGKRNLLNFIRSENKAFTKGMTNDDLGLAMIYFVVKADGSIGEIYIDQRSSSPAVDANLIRILENLPGKWEPATNAKGEKVDQELVLTFGLPGC